MAGVGPGMDCAAIPRVAAQLSRCFRTGVVPAEVAEPLRNCFPEALLLSVSVPSVGLTDDLLISLGNFLETGFPKVTLAAPHSSAAGRCYTSNARVECPHTAEQPGHEARFSDTEAAREGSSAEVLLCSPIPLSTASVIARSSSISEAASAQAECLGALTLGLRGVSSSMDGYKEDLHKLALVLAETIARDSQGLVVDVCKYQLGGPGPWPEEEPLSSLDLSTSCSEEGGKYSSSSGGPPEGGLPQLAEDLGGAQGEGDAGTDQGHGEQGDRDRCQQEGEGDASTDQGHREQQGDRDRSQRDEGHQGQEAEGTSPGGKEHGDQVRAQPKGDHQGFGPGAAEPGREEQGNDDICKQEGKRGHMKNDGHCKGATLAFNLAGMRMDDTAMRGASCQYRARLPDVNEQGQVANGEAHADRSADLQYRADMIDTYDAKAAGCVASAFEEPSHRPEPGHGSTGRPTNGYRHQDCSKGQNGHLSPSSSGMGHCHNEKQPGTCTDDSAVGKLGTQMPKRHSLARMPLMAYKEPHLERAYTLWHARHRWQVDAAGFVTMMFLSARYAGAFSEETLASWQSAVLASCQHVLPLLIMATCLPWYLRNRELVLGSYLVLSAAVTAYGSHRETLQLESQSALASLIWFSRAQSAEPLMLKSIIFALRFRMVVIVQALCVLVAASRAAHVCSVCCSAFISPAFCILKAWATQAVFGCGVPAAIFYFTEDTFRQVFEQQRLQQQA